MEKITSQTIADLLAYEGKGPAATLYVPMHAAALAENQLRLKNLIHEAQAHLTGRTDGDTLHPSLEKLHHDLAQDQAFTEHQTPGLLICAQDELVRVFQLPHETEAYVAIDTTFHIAPVLGLLHDAQTFYVLALSQHHPRLYIGDMYGLRPDHQLQLPESLETALRIDENNQKSEQSQSATGGTTYNGRGGARDPGPADRLRFWRHIDHALSGLNTSLPLILAGVDAETAEYRQISKHPSILQGSLTGNFEHADLRAAFTKANQIVRREVIDPKHQQALAAFQRLKGAETGLVAEDPQSIKAAAQAGRVDTLLVGLKRLTTDTVNDSMQPAERITFPTGTLRQALNSIVVAVKNTSGKVIVLDETHLRGAQPVAAILRY